MTATEPALPAIVAPARPASRWTRRCAEVAAGRPPPAGAPPALVLIAAGGLVVGDRFMWGGSRSLRVLATTDIDDTVIEAPCADESDPSMVVPLQLHRREQIPVTSPRPPLPETTR
jgi:hypothetical protein